MSERYTRLFLLQENLYAAGAPVFIAAGALLKDTVTGNVLAQLKMRNIGGRSIKAVTVQLSPFDTAGQPIGNAVEHQYLDLTAERDVDFGQKEPVILPEASTRSFDVAVTEVIFSDNSTWKASGESWEVLQEPPKLADTIEDAELLKQYRLTYGEDCKYSFYEGKDLWYCACGALNQKEEGTCHRCEKKLETLKTVDFSVLTAARDERLQQEQKERDEAGKRQKEKTKKLMKIGIPVLAVIIVASILISGFVKRGQAYAEAVQLLDNAFYYTDYEDAASAFEKLGNYKDSQERANESKYKLALAALNNSYADADSPDYSFALACEALGELPDDYEDTALLKETCEKYLPYCGFFQIVADDAENKNFNGFVLYSDFRYDYDTEKIYWLSDGEENKSIYVNKGDINCLEGEFPLNTQGNPQKSIVDGQLIVTITFSEQDTIKIEQNFPSVGVVRTFTATKQADQ